VAQNWIAALVVQFFVFSGAFSGNHKTLRGPLRIFFERGVRLGMSYPQ
jgi:hypothetical protein